MADMKIPVALVFAMAVQFGISATLSTTLSIFKVKFPRNKILLIY